MALNVSSEKCSAMFQDAMLATQLGSMFSMVKRSRVSMNKSKRNMVSSASTCDYCLQSEVVSLLAYRHSALYGAG